MFPLTNQANSLLLPEPISQILPFHFSLIQLALIKEASASQKT